MERDRSLLTCHPKLSNVIKRIEKVYILVVSHVVVDSPNSVYIRTPLTGVPETFISSQGPYVINLGELHHRRFTYVCLHKDNVGCHHDAEGVRCELKRSDFELL